MSIDPCPHEQRADRAAALARSCFTMLIPDSSCTRTTISSGRETSTFAPEAGHIQLNPESARYCPACKGDDGRGLCDA